MENVVAKHKAHIIFTDEFLAYDESLSQTVWRRLLGIFYADTEIAPATQQTTETRQVGRCGNHKNVAYPCLHKHRQGVIDHRFVIDGQKLLAHPFGNRIKTRTGATGQNYSFHCWFYDYGCKDTKL